MWLSRLLVLRGFFPINSNWKATVCQRKSFNINRHVFENIADMAQAFLDLAFFWQEMPDLSELKCSREYVDKMSNWLEDDSRGSLVCHCSICPLFFPPLVSPVANRAGSWEARNKAVSSSRVSELYSYGAHEVCSAFESFSKTFFHSEPWSEGNPRTFTLTVASSLLRQMKCTLDIITELSHKGQCVGEARVNRVTAENPNTQEKLRLGSAQRLSLKRPVKRAHMWDCVTYILIRPATQGTIFQYQIRFSVGINHLWSKQSYAALCQWRDSVFLPINILI